MILAHIQQLIGVLWLILACLTTNKTLKELASIMGPAYLIMSCLYGILVILGIIS